MIMGMAPRCASAAPVARLSAPGPRVDMQTPGFPVSRPCVAAMKAAACSCRVRTSSIFELRSDSTTSTAERPRGNDQDGSDGRQQRYHWRVARHGVEKQVIEERAKDRADGARRHEISPSSYALADGAT